MLEVILGIAAGVAAGFIPGLHINSLARTLDNDAVLAASGAYLVSSIFQSILFMSSIESNVGALPLISREVKKHGKLAVYVHHCLGVFIGLFFSFIIYNEGMLKVADSSLRPLFPYLLALAPLVLLLKSKNPFWFGLLLVLSGVLGMYGKDFEGGLFIVFSGLFALPALLGDFQGLSKEENVEKVGRLSRSSVGAALFGVVLGFMAAILPGISSPSVMATLFFPLNVEPLAHISLFASTMASQYVYAYRANEEIGTSRLGWVAFAGKELWLMLVGALVALVATKAAIKWASKFKGLRSVALAYILLSTAHFGLYGVLLLVAAGLVGKLAFSVEVEKTSLLGAILFPAAQYYVIPMLLP